MSSLIKIDEESKIDPSKKDKDHDLAERSENNSTINSTGDNVNNIGIKRQFVSEHRPNATFGNRHDALKASKDQTSQAIKSDSNDLGVIKDQLIRVDYTKTGSNANTKSTIYGEDINSTKILPEKAILFKNNNYNKRHIYDYSVAPRRQEDDNRSNFVDKIPGHMTVEWEYVPRYLLNEDNLDMEGYVYLPPRPGGIHGDNEEYDLIIREDQLDDIFIWDLIQSHVQYLNEVSYRNAYHMSRFKYNNFDKFNEPRHKFMKYNTGPTNQNMFDLMENNKYPTKSPTGISSDLPRYDTTLYRRRFFNGMEGDRKGNIYSHLFPMDFQNKQFQRNVFSYMDQHIGQLNSIVSNNNMYTGKMAENTRRTDKSRTYNDKHPAPFQNTDLKSDIVESLLRKGYPFSYRLSSGRIRLGSTKPWMTPKITKLHRSNNNNLHRSSKSFKSEYKL